MPHGQDRSCLVGPGDRSCWMDPAGQTLLGRGEGWASCGLRGCRSLSGTTDTAGLGGVFKSEFHSQCGPPVGVTAAEAPFRPLLRKNRKAFLPTEVPRMLVAAGRRRGPPASKGTPSRRQPDPYLRASRENPTARRKFTLDRERLTLHLMLQRRHIRRVPPSPREGVSSTSRNSSDTGPTGKVQGKAEHKGG